MLIIQLYITLLGAVIAGIINSIFQLIIIDVVYNGYKSILCSNYWVIESPFLCQLKYLNNTLGYSRPIILYGANTFTVEVFQAELYILTEQHKACLQYEIRIYHKTRSSDLEYLVNKFPELSPSILLPISGNERHQ